MNGLSGGAPETIRADGGRPGGTWASSRDLGMSSKTTLPDWKRIDDVVEGCGDDEEEEGEEEDGGDDASSHAPTGAIANKHCDAEIMQASWWHQEKKPNLSRRRLRQITGSGRYLSK